MLSRLPTVMTRVAEIEARLNDIGIRAQGPPSGGFARVLGSLSSPSGTASGRETTGFDPIISRAAKATGLSEDLIHAVVRAESNYNPRCRSSAGAMGLMQLMPGTARALGVSDAYDPAQNVLGGARYLREQLDTFGDLELALAAYNAGPGAVRRYDGVPPYDETQTYVRRVQRYLRERMTSAPTETPASEVAEEIVPAAGLMPEVNETLVRDDAGATVRRDTFRRGSQSALQARTRQTQGLPKTASERFEVRAPASDPRSPLPERPALLVEGRPATRANPNVAESSLPDTFRRLGSQITQRNQSSVSGPTERGPLDAIRPEAPAVSEKALRTETRPRDTAAPRVIAARSPDSPPTTRPEPARVLDARSGFREALAQPDRSTAPAPRPSQRMTPGERIPRPASSVIESTRPLRAEVAAEPARPATQAQSDRSTAPAPRPSQHMTPGERIPRPASSVIESTRPLRAEVVAEPARPATQARLDRQAPRPAPGAAASKPAPVAPGPAAAAPAAPAMPAATPPGEARPGQVVEATSVAVDAPSAPPRLSERRSHGERSARIAAPASSPDTIAATGGEFVGVRDAGFAPEQTRPLQPTVTIREPLRIAPAELTADRPQRVVLEVNPPNLGRCELELSLHEGRVRATVIADRPETAEMLRSVEGQIREHLAARDLRMAEFDVRDGLRPTLRDTAAPDPRSASEQGAWRGAGEGGRGQADREFAEMRAGLHTESQPADTAQEAPRLTAGGRTVDLIA